MATKKKAVKKRSAKKSKATTREKSPAMPERVEVYSSDERKVTLEQFLVACQKSLSRSTDSAEQASRADAGFLQGGRHLYMIDALNIDLSVALSMDFGDDGRPHSVLLNFDAPAPERSQLSFRVELRPLELLEGPALQISNLDPLRQRYPDAHFRVWIIDEDGAPVPNHPLTLHFMATTRTVRRQAVHVETSTDEAGRIHFSVRPRENEVRITGERTQSVLFRGALEYILWVTCDYPGIPEGLTTETMRIPVS